jgi:hypothetical protein
MKPISPFMVRYSGRSMSPVFQEGDLLEVLPFPIKLIRRGDCIVYRNSADLQVIHRAISNGAALRTRGDALREVDLGVVTQEQLVGRVIHRYRMGTSKRVIGGWPGMLTGRFYHFAGRIDPLRPSRGGLLARRIQRVTIPLLGGLLNRGEIREVSLAGQMPIVVWYWRQWVVGRRDGLSGEWAIYWPWRIILQKKND